MRFSFRHLTIWWGCGFKYTISTHHLFCPIGLNIREKPNFSNVCYCAYLTSSNCCSQDRNQTCVHQINWLCNHYTTWLCLFLFIVGLQKTNVIQSQPPYKPFLCTEQKNGEVLFLLLAVRTGFEPVSFLTILKILR